MVSKTIAKKNTQEKMKEELLISLRENYEVEKPGINIATVNVTK